jgi:hypothetical protein
VIAVYSENHMKHKHILWRVFVCVCVLEQVVLTVTTVL